MDHHGHWVRVHEGAPLNSPQRAEWNWAIAWNNPKYCWDWYEARRKEADERRARIAQDRMIVGVSALLALAGVMFQVILHVFG